MRLQIFLGSAGLPFLPHLYFPEHRLCRCWAYRSRGVCCSSFFLPPPPLFSFLVLFVRRHLYCFFHRKSPNRTSLRPLFVAPSVPLRPRYLFRLKYPSRT